MSKTKASKQEKVETSKEIKEVMMLFQSQVEHRGFLGKKFSGKKSTTPARDTFDAKALRKFHNYFMTVRLGDLTACLFIEIDIERLDCWVKQELKRRKMHETVSAICPGFGLLFLIMAWVTDMSCHAMS